MAFGDPAQVDLQVTTAPHTGDPTAADPAAADPAADPASDPAAAAAGDAATAPVTAALDQAAAGMKTLLVGFGLEYKAGRVLSTANAGRLRDAVTRLLEVLSDAGVQIDAPARGPVAGEDMADMAELKSGGELLDPSTYAAALRLRAGLE